MVWGLGPGVRVYVANWGIGLQLANLQERRK